jgi:hypothetical protein
VQPFVLESVPKTAQKKKYHTTAALEGLYSKSCSTGSKFGEKEKKKCQKTAKNSKKSVLLHNATRCKK